MIAYQCWEFWGDGDPMFGGKAADRILADDGSFIEQPWTGGQDAGKPKAAFVTKDDAILAGRQARNRRAGSLISAVTITV